MSTPKIKGIETEWGVGLKSQNGFEPAEIGYLHKIIDIVRKYLDLVPDSADRFLAEIENVERIEYLRDELNHLRKIGFRFHNNLLPNGSRLYLDGEHLEYSTPECLSAKTLVAADKAGEAIVGLARVVLNEQLAEHGAELIFYKDNTDRNGNSYGCHENYLVSREAFNKIVNVGFLEAGYLASFFICRLIFTGAGKMGIEKDRIMLNKSVFQISQRADFIKELLNLCTINHRPLVNTRDEPHADRERFGRLHVILGDANLAEVASYMKVGITSIILKMIEDGFLKGDIIVLDPVLGIKLVSEDLTCKKPLLETLYGRKLSSLNLSEEFFQKAKDYFNKVSEPSSEETDLMRLWEETNSDFRTGNKARLRRRFDWQIKLGMFEDFLEEHGFSWADIGGASFKSGKHMLKVSTHLHLKDVLYHNMDKEKGLYWACKEDGDIEEVVSRQDVLALIKDPPPECRSYFRGRCIAKFFKDIDAVDWDQILFKDAAPRNNKNFSVYHTYQAINLCNPVWGSKSDTEEIINRADSCDDLISALKKIEEVQNA